MLKRIAFLSFLLIVIFSCQSSDKKEKEIAEIPISFEVDRFDQKFAQATPQTLPELKRDYPFLFPEQYSDSIWYGLLTDSIQLEINREVSHIFPDFEEQEEELKGLFQHLKYYYPEFSTPKVITITSDVDYRNSVILANDILLISLDTYLGPDHHFYYGVYSYFTKNFRKSQIVTDVAREYAERLVPRPSDRELIDYMVYYGKLLYFKQQMLPQNSEANIIGYTDEELAWAEDNEREIWGYFIERNLLFQTDPDLRRKFLDPGPFTRFGLELDNESPSQLGRFLGWNIVKQYVEKHKTDLKELMELDNQKLFKESNYKPKQR